MPERRTSKKSYKVGRGENWKDIERKTGIPVVQLMAMNPGVTTPSAGITLNYTQNDEKNYNPNMARVSRYNPMGLNMNALPQNLTQKNDKRWTYDPHQYGVDPRYRKQISYTGEPSKPLTSYAQGEKNYFSSDTFGTPSFVNPAYSNVNMPNRFQFSGQGYQKPAYSNTMPVQFGNITQGGWGGSGGTPLNYVQSEKGYNPYNQQWGQPYFRLNNPAAINAPIDYNNGRGLGQGMSGYQMIARGTDVNNPRAGDALRAYGIRGDKWRVGYGTGADGRVNLVTTYARRGKRGGGGDAPQVNQDGSLVAGSDWTVSTG